MGSLVATCDGCGVRIRTSRPEVTRERTCPKCQTPLAESIARALAAASELTAPLVASQGSVSLEASRVVIATAPEELPPASTRGGLSGLFEPRAIGAGGALLVLVTALAVGSARLTDRPPPPRRPTQVANQSVPPPPVPSDQVRCPARDLTSPVTTRPAEPDLTPSRSNPPPSPTPVSTLASRESVASSAQSVLRIPPPVAPPRLVAPPDDPVPPPPASGREGSPALPSPPGGGASLSSKDEPKRVLVRDDSGRPVVTRVYCDMADTLVVLLPDGQLGWPDGRAYTEKAFHPASADELRESLREGPYREFKVRQSRHYLLLYRCSENFAGASANLLESLYQGLYKKFADLGLEVHEAEFPLIAIIYDTERAFRANNKVAPEVQAFHHTISNRIYFYETSERELSSPEVAAIRKPQTIAHEGTHQILLNIGVQPRLARWPIWLVEGLAEYCAPTYTRRGAEW